MTITVWLCHIARGCNFLIDEGRQLDLLETRRHVLDGDLLSWMDERFPDANLGLSAIPSVDQAEVYERFQDMALVHTERKYGVSSNGLCLLVGYCIEGIQQLHPPTLNPDPDR